jgi:hypothetical protein
MLAARFQLVSGPHEAIFPLQQQNFTLQPYQAKNISYFLPT